MSTQTKRMQERKDNTPGPAEFAQNAVDKGVAYLQDTIFGPGTSDTAQPVKTPADPRLKSAPNTNIEEAVRDQNLSEPPTELLQEANAAKREGERGERAGETSGGQRSGKEVVQ